jgi:hypothetical protein
MDFDAKSLGSWTTQIVFANTAFHDTRKQLWEKLSTCKPVSGSPTVHLSLAVILKLKNFLTSRSEDLKDPAKLAFSVALTQVIEALKPPSLHDLETTLELDESKVEHKPESAAEHQEEV